MHEYRLHPSLYETIPSYETEEIILCRIQHKEEPQTRATATASQPRPHQYPTNAGAMDGGTFHPEHGN
ncbi:hypothetical protein MUK42_27789 [Musa troglodytarum]|uniref:NAC domain-containing protein n=1 Tax=Musa troglodytarum TaxID=320322 RepID=A0A9E7F772_9LILI|nr:hypothetical protein MUK42_27789 [Musa troglodytarum]